MSHWWGKSLLLLLLSVFLVSYQNCSWNGSDSNFRGAQFGKQASLTGGDTYDGKPEADYIRRVPGYTCGGTASEYGSLNILGDSALLTLRDGEQCSEEISIRTSDLYSTPNTDAVLGYKGAIYTKSDSVLSTSPETFTEVWCQQKSDDKKEIIADFVVQWEQAGATAMGYAFRSPGADPSKIEMYRRLGINQVTYWSKEWDLIIHKVAKSGDGLYVGYYQEMFGSVKVPVECRLGGQFDPAAPQLMYPQSSVTFEVGKPVEKFTPLTSHSNATFAIEPTLPEGLTFNATNGQISGAPTEPQKRTLYQVTMMFKFGEVSASIFIGAGKKVQVTTTDLSSAPVDGGLSCLKGEGECTLRSALSLAANDLENQFIIELPAGTFFPNGKELVVNGNVTMNGHPTKPTTFDGQRLSRIFRVEPESFFELNRLRLINGRTTLGGGALKAQKSSIIIKDSLFEGNSVTEPGEGPGGAVYVWMGESFEIYNSKFLNNNNKEVSQQSRGGAVYADYPTRLIIQGSEFRGNLSGSGGALFLYAPGNGVTYLKENQFIDNEGIFRGGAAKIQGGHIYVDSTLFDGNTAFFGGGNLHLDLISTLKVTNSTFTRSQSRAGSALYFGFMHMDTVSIVKNSQFINNNFTLDTGFGTDGQGVMIYLREGSVMLKDSVFRDNARYEGCQVIFTGPAYGFGPQSMGGNTFEDRTCNPTEEDVILE